MSRETVPHPLPWVVWVPSSSHLHPLLQKIGRPQTFDRTGRVRPVSEYAPARASHGFAKPTSTSNDPNCFSDSPASFPLSSCSYILDFRSKIAYEVSIVGRPMASSSISLAARALTPLLGRLHTVGFYPDQPKKRHEYNPPRRKNGTIEEKSSPCHVSVRQWSSSLQPCSQLSPSLYRRVQPSGRGKSLLRLLQPSPYWSWIEAPSRRHRGEGVTRKFAIALWLSIKVAASFS